MINLIISLIIGISAATLVWVVFVVEKDLSPNVLRRLDRIKRKSNLTDLTENGEELDLSKQNTEYKFEEMGNFLERFSISQKIKKLIMLADSSLHADTFIFLSLLSAVPCLFFLGSPSKLIALFSIVTLFIPTIYLNYLIDKRFLDFSKQFPDALNLMSSSLRAGHPLFAAVDIVSEEMPKPVCDVFHTVQKDLSLGIDTKEAFYNMTRMMPNSIDLRFFITAVLIQKEVGGNLAELLDKLSGTIRERFKLMGLLRVQTAQTRISGIILGIIPVAILIGVFFLNPDYIKPLLDTKDGQLAFTTAILLIIAGFISVKKISNVEM